MAVYKQSRGLSPTRVKGSSSLGKAWCLTRSEEGSTVAEGGSMRLREVSEQSLKKFHSGPR